MSHGCAIECFGTFRIQSRGFAKFDVRMSLQEMRDPCSAGFTTTDGSCLFVYSSFAERVTGRAEVLDPVNKNLLLLWGHELLLPVCFSVRLGEAMKATAESIIRNTHMMSF